MLSRPRYSSCLAAASSSCFSQKKQLHNSLTHSVTQSQASLNPVSALSRETRVGERVRDEENACFACLDHRTTHETNSSSYSTDRRRFLNNDFCPPVSVAALVAVSWHTVRFFQHALPCRRYPFLAQSNFLLLSRSAQKTAVPKIECRRLTTKAEQKAVL